MGSEADYFGVTVDDLKHSREVTARMDAIIVSGSAKEIADLVLALQGQRNRRDIKKAELAKDLVQQHVVSTDRSRRRLSAKRLASWPKSGLLELEGRELDKETAPTEATEDLRICREGRKPIC